ncbi:hypothetical protein BX600DRAFT_505863 [Xylariales sp. PMI_506]|nr:hypothetical protein BX600DRAFT_505863 [Xylariales sp. PMI_506]
MSDGEWYGSRSSTPISLPGDGGLYPRTYSDGAKRPFVNLEYLDLTAEDAVVDHRPKRPRYLSSAFNRAHEPAFFILREAGRPLRSLSDFGQADTESVPRGSPSLPDRKALNEMLRQRFERVAELRSHSMERTSSGLSIATDDEEFPSPSSYSDMRKDEQAASRVERHFAHYRTRARDSTAERILKSLISPRSFPGQEFEIDDDALQSIFRAANEIFFFGCLKNRVRWDWSDGSNERYHTQIIGTTALRVAEEGGYETLIVLSHHYLRDKRYNRRLLISTFLHELIHSYLFIRCGFKAKRSGGHTQGFHRIAKLIDEWAGPDTLFLSNMEADLEDFRLGGQISYDPEDVYHNCGMHFRNDVRVNELAASRTGRPALR